MNKKILSEQSLYYGDVLMPKGFEIDHKQLLEDVLKSHITNKKLIYSSNFNNLETYFREHIKCDYQIHLVPKKRWGNIYKPKELSEPLLNIEKMDLANSADFTLLYGVETNECSVKIYYDDNRRKQNTWTIKLDKGMFIMFPSSNTYVIKNNQNESLNNIITITYEHM